LHLPGIRKLSSIDIGKYITPLSDEEPTGPDLDVVGDADFQQLDIVSRGTPDQVTRVSDPENPGSEIDKVIPGEPPDAKAIIKVSDAIFEKTRDLRVCGPLAYALTRLHGLPGLAAGLEIVAELLAAQWDAVHPRVSADYDFDVGYRIRVLMALADRDGLLRAVRETPFAEARAVGRFSMRDLEVVRGELAPLQGQNAPSLDLIRGALQEGDVEQVAERKQAIGSAIAAIDRIDGAFVAATGVGGPDLTLLRKILAGAQSIFVGSGTADAAAGNSDDQPEGPVGGGSASVAGGAQRLASRADAKRQLESVAEFLERTEPAHPSAMFIRRATKLLDMNFLEIVRELAPDSMGDVRHLGGIREDD
jgi:type VI secretion system protein ImpA